MESFINCEIEIREVLLGEGLVKFEKNLISRRFVCDLVYEPLNIEFDIFAHAFKILNAASNIIEDSIMQRFHYFHPFIYGDDREIVHENQYGLILTRVRRDADENFSSFFGYISAEICHIF